MTTLRSSSGQVYSSGSVYFNDTEGQETVSLTSCHGHDITFDGQTSHFFCPTNDQRKINGNSFDEVQGHRTTYTKRHCDFTTGGNLTLVTGTPRLYDKNDNTLSEYVDIRAELATLQCTPTKAVGGTTNNGSKPFKFDGGVNKESGSTEGGKFKDNNLRNKYDEFVLGNASKMLKLEQKMGEGGNIMLHSAKDILITAGCKSLPLPSGYINPIGKQIPGSYTINKKGKKETGATPVFTSTPTFAPKNTTATIPFGALNFVSSNRVFFETGPGGFEVLGTGQVKLVGTGLTHIAGRQVNLVSTGTTYINSKGAIMLTAPNFNVDSPDALFTGNTHINKNVNVGGDMVIGGNLLVKGNLHVEGKITTDEYVFAETNIATAGNINAFSSEGGGSGLSFKDHVHPQNNGNDQGGGVNTSSPVR